MKLLISTNRGGLANRMKSLVSCYRSDHEYQIGVYWPVIDEYSRGNNFLLNCPFEKLFTNQIQMTKGDLSPSNRDVTVYDSHCLRILDLDPIPNKFSIFDSKCQVKYSRNRIDGRNIDFEYFRIPKALREEYSINFKKLILQPKLVEEVNSFSLKFNPQTISVHIRTWNKPNEESRRETLNNYQKFETVMLEKINSNGQIKFFLSTDSGDCLNYFKQHAILGDRILNYPRITDLDSSRNNPIGVQEDLIDLYLLARTGEIIGSHFSTFTEVAWYLADCPPITII